MNYFWRCIAGDTVVVDTLPLNYPPPSSIDPLSPTNQPTNCDGLPPSHLATLMVIISTGYIARLNNG